VTRAPIGVRRIRPIAPHDAERWIALRRELWPPDTHDAEVAAFFRGDLEEPLEVLVAEAEGSEIVGFVELSIRPQVPGSSSGRVAYIEGLYVTPPARGSGVARALVSASRRWARALGCGALATDRAERIIVDPGFA
jgi:aminoglycoside 6'-N-acetyltransferase I